MTILSWEIPQGSTFTVRAVVKDDGVVRDLTGYVARMQFRRKTSSANPPDISLTSSPLAGIVITAVDGQIDFTITDEQTAALTGKYVFDAELESPAGAVTRLFQGKAKILPEVTR
jgi:hypothetical protein